MSWVYVAVAAATVVGSAYSADQQRKGVHAQMDAAKAAAEEDARKAAEAETGALVAANAKLADQKRRRRAGLLGSSDTVLGLGGASIMPSAASRATAAATPAATVLGGGTPAAKVV